MTCRLLSQHMSFSSCACAGQGYLPGAPDLAGWRAGCIAYRLTVEGQPSQYKLRVVDMASRCAGRVGHYLVEENILPVSAFCRKVFEVAVLIDAVFETQLLPELRAHCPVGLSVFCSASFSLFLSLSISLPLHLSLSLFLYISLHLSISPSPSLSISLHLFPSLSISICR